MFQWISACFHWIALTSDYLESVQFKMAARAKQSHKIGHNVVDFKDMD